MRSIEFLKEKLFNLNIVCPYLNIKYEYRDYIGTHIIDIRPLNSFESDKNYIDEQIRIEEEFEELFPFDEILFVSENSITKIESPILEFEPFDADKFTVVFEEPYFDEIFFNDMAQAPYLKCYQLDESDYIDIEPSTNVQIEISPPKESWWHTLTNKKSSKKKLELFLINFVLW